MAARTPISVVQLVRDGSVREDNAGTTINQATGMYVPAALGPASSASVPAAKLLLLVSNTAGSPFAVTIRATGSSTNASGNAWPATAPSNVVYAGATQGDLAVTVTNGQSVMLGPFTGDRFLQSDGTVTVDFASGFTGTIWAFILPQVWV